MQLDVTDDASVAAAVRTIEAAGGLDVLVNNAGIEARGADNEVAGAAEVTADLMREVFETNVFGTVRITHAFLPLLRRSAAPVVVNLSSGLASITRAAEPGHPAAAYPGVEYPASKTAVNMNTVRYAKAFPDMRINAVEPGFTRTDLNGNTGVQTVEEGTEIIVRMAQVAGLDGPTRGVIRRGRAPPLAAVRQASGGPGIRPLALLPAPGRAGACPRAARTSGPALVPPYRGRPDAIR